LSAVKNSFYIGDRRIVGDRRKLRSRFLSKHTIFGGRRRIIRRREDKKSHILVDSYDLRTFIVILLLLMLSISDAYLTLTLVKTYDAIELNPIMALYLEAGNITFFLEKFLITSMAVFIFCVFSHRAVTRVFLGLSIIIYSGLVYYEVSLLNSLLK
jgi:hypothetical protein